MKAFVINGKLDAGVQELETPEPGENQVRLRIAYAGICGSDLHYYFDGAVGAFVVREPLVPGHEVCGIVDEDPSGIYAKGTRVTLHPATFGESRPGIEDQPHLWPNGAYLGSASTWPHSQGGMKEYLLVRPDQIRVLPDSLPMKRAALTEPLSVALHGINVAGGVEGQRVFVSGSGPIGLLATAAAHALGAASVTASDLLDGPLSRAKAVGADQTIKIGTDEIPEEAFDVVLECSGVVPGTNGAIKAVRRHGIVAQVGMLPAGGQPIDMASIISKEVQLRGCFRFKDEVEQAIEVLDANPVIDEVITHVVAGDDAESGFTTAKNSEISGKVVVDCWTGGQIA